MVQPAVIGIIKSCIVEARGCEIAGYLLEDKNGEQSFQMMFNALSGRYHFFVTEEESERLKRYALINNLKLTAFVHSHYESMELSKEDMEAFSQSNLPWVI